MGVRKFPIFDGYESGRHVQNPQYFPRYNHRPFRFNQQIFADQHRPFSVCLWKPPLFFQKSPGFKLKKWKICFFLRVILNVPCSQLWIVDKTYHVFTSSCLHPTTSRVNKYLSYRFRTWYGRFKGFDESISAIRTRPIETFHLKVNQKCFFRNPRGFIDNNPVKLYVRWFLSKMGVFRRTLTSKRR